MDNLNVAKGSNNKTSFINKINMYFPKGIVGTYTLCNKQWSWGGGLAGCCCKKNSGAAKRAKGK